MNTTKMSKKNINGQIIFKEIDNSLVSAYESAGWRQCAKKQNIEQNNVKNNDKSFEVKNKKNK